MNNIQTQVSPFSILVISDKGIKRMYCPFKVRAIENVFDKLSKGKTYHVERVKIGRSEPLIYVVGDNDYPHRYFVIE